MASGPTHEELSRDFWPLGEWPDGATRARIEHIAAEGEQASAEQIRASLPQSDGLLRVGMAAPAAEFTTLDGGARSLAELLAADTAAGKLSVLNFGSWTWPPFRASAARVEQIAAAHGARVALRHVYILEAHPADGWIDQDNIDDGVCLRQPKTLEQRVAAAAVFAAEGTAGRAEILVDGMDNAAELAYEARPEKLVVVDGEGVVRFLSGIGPYQYSPRKLAEFLESQLHAFDLEATLDRGALSAALREATA